MKKIILSAAAALGVCLGAWAQPGNFVLDNSTSTNRLAAEPSGNWYSGTYGMEVWVLKGTDIPAGLNPSPAAGSGIIGYDAMRAAGFVREATYTNQFTAGPGLFKLGPLFMPHAHSGGTVILALAAWNSGAPSWSAMRASANESTRAGIVFFQQPTTPLLTNPGIPARLALDRDLVLTAVAKP
ncbi:MAG: hypothetical protein NT154_17035 [Verrucomicrobia bacterium]|nr:hypothetical protein [Verrucomicrobiota bacterium]